MPTLRHKMTALIGALTLVSTVCLFGGVAQAQAGYPPGTGQSLCDAGNVNAGTVRVGQTITFTLCGDFTSGPITVSVNGAVVLTKSTTQITNGAVIVVITVVSNTVLAVSDPIDVAAICGNNTATATGKGTPGTSTGTFDVLCTSAATTSGPLPLTGADVTGLILGALALIGLGVVLRVSTSRRRRSTVL